MIPTGKHFIDKLEKAKESYGKRKGPHVRWLKEQVDDSVLTIPSHDFATGIPTLSRLLNDFEEGVACLAGKPNACKSTIMVNMMLDSLAANSDLIVVDLSLDDTFRKRYCQYLASRSGLHYQEITTDTPLTDTQIAAKEAGEGLIRSYYEAGRLFTLESIEDFPVEEGSSSVRRVPMRSAKNIISSMAQMRSKNPDKKIAYFIDAWNNIDTSSVKGFSDLEKSSNLLDELQEAANKYQVMNFVSAHLRKSSDKKSIGLEDIKGTANMMYNAQWAGIVRNEYRENLYKDPLLYSENGRYHPLIAIEVLKTKVSAWDQPAFYGCKPSQCQLVSVTEDQYLDYFSQYNNPKRS